MWNNACYFTFSTVILRVENLNNQKLGLLHFQNVISSTTMGVFTIKPLSIQKLIFLEHAIVFLKEIVRVPTTHIPTTYVHIIILMRRPLNTNSIIIVC